MSLRLTPAVDRRRQVEVVRIASMRTAAHRLALCVRGRRDEAVITAECGATGEA
ncbi:hypothetical protein ACFFSQ_11820 [Dactylosporangium matsuzakiense]|uniref:hypothetical protein n=1 Tax=Dactylosporangium matsuzakiense TaxID=53360 RepID=UPI0031F1A834